MNSEYIKISKFIKNIEKSVEDLEKSIPTTDEIERQTNIKVLSIKKYFHQLFRAKLVVIPDVYVIFIDTKERYIGYSKDILYIINQHMNPFSRIRNILVVYIYQTEKNIDARLLEFWFINTLKPELNIVYPNKELILKNISVDRKPTLVADKYLLIRARKQGNTTVMSLSRFVEAGKFYTVKKQEDHSIIIREADVKIK